MNPGDSVQALEYSLQNFSKDASDSARVDLISKAKDLIFALQSSEKHVFQLSANAIEFVAIRTLIRFGVLDLLPCEKNAAIELEALAEKTEVQEALLERFLRFLVGTRFIKQDERGNYFHSHVSKHYVEGGSAGAWFKGAVYDSVMEAFINYPTKYLDAHSSRTEPSDLNTTTISFGWGKEGENMWQVFARDYPHKMLNFQRGMALMVDAMPVTGAYDFSQLVRGNDGNERLVLVDVGGGSGHCVETILKTHPDIPAGKCMVQDLAHVLEHARQNPTLPKGVQLLEHDFFTPQPVAHAKAYFMRWIIHDYVDVHAVKILKHIAEAMAYDSVLLIHEAVVPERLDEGSMMAGILDLAVLNCAGKERTKKGFETLLGQVGLTVTKYWEREGTVATIIEVVKG